ncbi:MASE1 domain-containing protein [Salmonella enterica subsp. enterica serovar Infantis]|nr:MASE1 domain-containing protein [Salmonella enterica subsp. enterica serovar Infantis]
MLSLMLFFGWAALPGIVLAIFWRRYPQTGLYETLSVTMHFIITIVLSWGGYRVFSPRRNNVSTATPTCCFNEYSGRYFVLQHYFWSSTSLPLCWHVRKQSQPDGGNAL